MRNPKAPAAARIAAASALLDRGYGRPLQTVDASNTNVNYVDEGYAKAAGYVIVDGRRSL
jgi:hypothetical protein